MHKVLVAAGGIFLALAVVASAAHAQESKAKADDSSLLRLFDGKTAFGWKAEPAKALSVAENDMRLRDLNVRNGVATFSVPFPAFELQGEYRAAGEPKSPCSIRISQGAKDLAFDLPPTEKRTAFKLVADGKKATWSILGTDASIDVEGTGPFEISLQAPAEHTLMIRSLTLRPTGLQSIFNGKDLTGWKVFPGKKSTFDVEGGILRVKDGPGDLQTEKKYGDFILQLECKTNGKHLNSGVFFRCREGEYQNGYEAQIRNQFTDEATQDYVVEEYDPKTHQLLEKKKIKSTAVDFGTGAIYRRVPARLGVAQDNEWFTMTVIAHGNHLATFVNGVMTADWYDWRPASDNARTGFRLEAGHISLQGHDPTTDLSFRNFRIAEYSKP